MAGFLYVGCTPHGIRVNPFSISLSDSSDERDSVPSDKEEPGDKEKSSEANFTKESTR